MPNVGLVSERECSGAIAGKRSRGISRRCRFTISFTLRLCIFIAADFRAQGNRPIVQNEIACLTFFARCGGKSKACQNSKDE